MGIIQQRKCAKNGSSQPERIEWRKCAITSNSSTFILFLLLPLSPATFVIGVVGRFHPLNPPKCLLPSSFAFQGVFDEFGGQEGKGYEKTRKMCGFAPFIHSRPSPQSSKSNQIPASQSHRSPTKIFFFSSISKPNKNNKTYSFYFYLPQICTKLILSIPFSANIQSKNSSKMIGMMNNHQMDNPVEFYASRQRIALSDGQQQQLRIQLVPVQKKLSYSEDGRRLVDGEPEESSETPNQMWGKLMLQISCNKAIEGGSKDWKWHQ